MKKKWQRIGLAAATALGGLALSAAPAGAYYDCTDYDGWTYCYWYEDPQPDPYSDPYWWECYDSNQCSPCDPCSA